MKKYDISILAAGCLWGVIGLFTRRLTAMGIPSSGVLLLRSGGCAVVFAVAILLKSPKLFRFRLKYLPVLLLFGLSTLFFTFCYYRSIDLAGLGVACTLMYCAPAFVMLMSVFVFKERFTARKGVCLICTIAGCCLVSGLLEGDVGLSLAGVVYGVLSGIGYALYNILSKILSSRGGFDVLTLNFYGWGLCALGSLAVWGAAPAAPIVASAENILIWIGMVLISGAAPAFLYNWGLQRVEASKASMMGSVEPVVASLSGFAAFGEIPTVLSIIGFVLILGSVAVLNARPRTETAQ